jgi:endonuclease/exonuclease/phosphatase family metal-dependent hydrolase
MKILTFNCWGKYGPLARQPYLFKTIRDVNADILCLQEAPDATFLQSLRYPVVFHDPQTGLALLSRFPAVGQSHTRLYKTRSPLEEYPRGVLLAELLVGRNNLWVGTTHLSWKAEDEASRFAQAEELAKGSQTLKGTLLMGGDFNASPEQAPVRRLREAGFVDLFGTLHPKDKGITWDNANPFIQSHSVRFPDRRIDLLLLRETTAGEWPPSDCAIACREPDSSGMHASDHYGVTVTFPSL